MRSAYHSSSIDTRGAAWRRSSALALTIVAHILIILLLMQLAPSLRTSPLAQRNPVTFQMLPDRGAPAPAQHVPSPATAKPASRGDRSPLPAPPRVLADAKNAPPPPPGKLTLPIELLGGDELFKAADVAKLPVHPEDRLAKVEKDKPFVRTKAAAIIGPGDGPNGGPMYDMADWYHVPTDAEMNGYLTRQPPGSWGLIACRALPDNRVDNCRTLAESPIGSGIGRAMRLASWQYRIIPPQIDGKKMIGSTIRIKLTYTEGGFR